MTRYVVIGGGIAGVTCAEYLLRTIRCGSPGLVVVISSSDLVKKIEIVQNHGRHIPEYSFKELSASEWRDEHLEVVSGHIVSVDTLSKSVHLASGENISFDVLCICSGSVPRSPWKHRRVITLKDAKSINELCHMLPSIKRLMVIGNGGIALEVVAKFRKVAEIVWVMRDTSIGTKFFDVGASEFLLKSSFHLRETSTTHSYSPVAKFYPIERDDNENISVGASLGPQWDSAFPQGEEAEEKDAVLVDNVLLEKTSEVVSISDSDCDYALSVLLSNGKVVKCDAVIVGLGVIPTTHFLGNEFRKNKNGALEVDENMQTNIPHIFAAGDCCSPSWNHSPLWFQMLLWSQAHPMALHAAHHMVADTHRTLDSHAAMAFEMFSHVTRFFGFKVILLGCYNGQGLDDYELLVRFTIGQEYIKLVLKNGKIQGALLIGDTDLEETIENLILNQLDVGHLGEALLDPNIDIDDYFD